MNTLQKISLSLSVMTAGSFLTSITAHAMLIKAQRAVASVASFVATEKGPMLLAANRAVQFGLSKGSLSTVPKCAVYGNAPSRGNCSRSLLVDATFQAKDVSKLLQSHSKIINDKDTAIVRRGNRLYFDASLGFIHLETAEKATLLSWPGHHGRDALWWHECSVLDLENARYGKYEQHTLDEAKRLIRNNQEAIDTLGLVKEAALRYLELVKSYGSNSDQAKWAANLLDQKCSTLEELMKSIREEDEFIAKRKEKK